jgi:hypothetical protein
VSDKTAPQPEKYWRARIAEEIRDYDDETHGYCDHDWCVRCDISAALQNVALRIESNTMEA